MSMNVDPVALLKNNGVLWDVKNTVVHIGKLTIPLDGYSDSLRIHSYLKECLASPAAVLMMPPMSNSFAANSFADQWKLAKDFHDDCPRHLTQVRWGGSFQTSLDDYLDCDTGSDGEFADGDEYVPANGTSTYKLPVLTGPHYYNITLPYDKAILFQGDGSARGWKVLRCKGCSLQGKHLHAVSGLYYSQATVEDELVELAPPVRFASGHSIALSLDACSLVKQAVACASRAAAVVGETPHEPKKQTPVDRAFQSYSQLSEAFLSSGNFAIVAAAKRDPASAMLGKITFHTSGNNARSIKSRLGALYTQIVGNIGPGLTPAEALGQIDDLTRDLPHNQLSQSRGYLLLRLAAADSGVVQIDGLLKLAQ